MTKYLMIILGCLMIGCGRGPEKYDMYESNVTKRRVEVTSVGKGMEIYRAMNGVIEDLKAHTNELVPFSISFPDSELFGDKPCVMYSYVTLKKGYSFTIYEVTPETKFLRNYRRVN